MGQDMYERYRIVVSSKIPESNDASANLIGLAQGSGVELREINTACSFLAMLISDNLNCLQGTVLNDGCLPNFFV